MTKRPPVIVEKRRSPYIAPARPPAPPSPWNSFDVRPKYGKRVVAIHRWGEDSEEFFVDHNFLRDKFGEKVPFAADYIGAFSHWCYLPDGHRLYFERRQRIPMTTREIEATRRWPKWPEAVAKATREEEGR